MILSEISNAPQLCIDQTHESSVNQWFCVLLQHLTRYAFASSNKLDQSTQMLKIDFQGSVYTFGEKKRGNKLPPSQKKKKKPTLAHVSRLLAFKEPTLRMIHNSFEDANKEWV